MKRQARKFLFALAVCLPFLIPHYVFGQSRKSICSWQVDSNVSNRESRPITMKIILISIGTRGDMEPFLAIGEILKKKGHHVICAFPEQFRNLAEDSSLEFASLGAKFIELLESEDGKAAMGGSGSGLRKFFAMLRTSSNPNRFHP